MHEVTQPIVTGFEDRGREPRPKEQRQLLEAGNSRQLAASTGRADIRPAPTGNWILSTIQIRRK